MNASIQRVAVATLVSVIGLLGARAARASCSDGIQNGTETGVDCGGSCLQCNGGSCASNAACSSGSCVDSVCATVLSLDTSQGTSAAQPGGVAIAVDPTITIAGSGTVTGARVLIASGFVASEDVLSFATSGAISGSYTSATGVLTLSGTATVAQYEAALRTVKYQNTRVSGASTVDRVITFALGPNGLALQTNGHFYEFVTVNTGEAADKYWAACRDAAAARRYFGLQGYLVTVTNAVENTFVSGKLAGQGWMGSSDLAVEGTWRWVTGPEGLEGGGGRLFYMGVTDTGYPTNGYPLDPNGKVVVGDSSCTQASDCESNICVSNVCKAYDNWNGAPGTRTEPNNSGDEDYGHFLVGGLWNDYYTNNPSIAGYVVEYGGMPNDPPVVLQDNKTVRIVSISCSDGTQNGSETGIDCGGSCSACATGKGCQVDGDCQSFVCQGLVCQAPACDDGKRNGSETATDCGGSCVADCADGLGCNSGGDCQSGKCTSNVCQVASCTDSVKNNGETDVDCGGPSCGDCGDGNACLGNGDCVSLRCANNVCQSAGCTDNIQNGSETAVDCGGSCGPCADDLGCNVANDCASRVCTGHLCQPATCSDGARNGSETGVDCGGACPLDCPVGGGCAGGQDCVTGVCSSSVCQAATCNDGVRNQDETGVDCGGPTCTGDCAAGGGCTSGADCVSGVCSGQICQAPSCTDGVKNGSETAQDCGGSCGATCLTNQACTGAGDCRDGKCTGNLCAAPTCSDTIKNGGESDVDCGGTWPACPEGGLCAGDADCGVNHCALGHCTSATCEDGMQNGNETGRDCGGADCDPCAYGQGCVLEADCDDDTTCTNNVCRCRAGEALGTSGQCLRPDECDGLVACSAATDLPFFGTVNDAAGQPYGTFRCTLAAATNTVTCDTEANGSLKITPVLWCH